MASRRAGLHRGTALDFGCGVGRLSQALTKYFEQVAGVDISHTMIAKAKEVDHGPARIRYVVKTTADLAGGRIVEVVNVGSGRPGSSLRYCVTC